jgi:LPXTG-site transpeptidase (sortase) family protein
VSRQRLLASVAVAAGVATILTVVVSVLGSGADTSVGTVPLLEPAPPPPTVPLPPAPPPLVSVPAPAASWAETPRPVPTIETRSARIGDREQRRAPEPVALRIPAIGVDATVVPAGIEASTGQMELPPDRLAVAWYRHGPSPGTSGSAVLAGHVDYGEGRAVFYRLADLEPGNALVVTYGDGSRRRFRVVGRRLYDKERLPERVFATSGKAVLTLITCGGGYERAERSYDGNVVVYAVPE